MASKSHPSDAIFSKFPAVSKDKLTVDDALAVQKAVSRVLDRIINIGQALSVDGQRISEIKRLHADGNRRAIAVIDTWLRGNYNASNKPYSNHSEEQYRCPSWWNLVWAVAHKTGGANPAIAKVIAEKHATFQQESTAPEHNFQSVTTETFDEDITEQIRDELSDVWAKWYEIGVGLKLSTATLDTLEEGGPEDKMLGVITTWIREDFDGACWRRLLEVVAASYGGQNPALAKALAKEHTISEGEKNGAEPMDVEPKPKPSSTTVDETGPAQVVSEDSAVPQSTHTTSDPQPLLPAARITDDGAKPAVDQFIVYTRQSHRRNSGKQPHGLALVISNENFSASTKLSRRICSPFDDQRLKETLKALGYRVVIRKDQTGAQMNELFETIQVNRSGDLHIKDSDDSFICVISSHGDWDAQLNTDVIYGRDKAPLYLQKTAYDKLSAGVCKHLKGKPKLFFVQACRGAGYGRIADDSGTQVPLPPRLPRESDFFFSYSTAPETKSFRFDPNRAQPEGEPIDTSLDDENYDGYAIGSFYITELCLAMKRLAEKMDLMTMVLSVHQNLQATDKNLFHVGAHTTRQCPHMTVSLRGHVFFYDEAEDLFKDYMKKCLK